MTILRAAVRFAACASVLALAACNPMGGPAGLGGGAQQAGAPTQQVNETIGAGPTKIGLIIPLTGGAGQAAVGASLRDAAKLAYADSGASDVSILVKDDQSTPAGATAATHAALSEGAEIILGPVFAQNVREASRVARGANRPLIEIGRAHV